MCITKYFIELILTITKDYQGKKGKNKKKIKLAWKKGGNVKWYKRGNKEKREKYGKSVK